MASFFNEILYRPLFNALIFLYNVFPFHDFGIAVILLTILIRLILLPLFYKGARDQAILQRLAPKLKELQEKHKGDREAQAKAMMALYREHRVNPMTGFLLLVIQLPILIALYRVFLGGFSPKNFSELYSFIARPAFINHQFLGFVDLSASSILLAILVGISQYFLGRLTLAPKAEPTLASKNKNKTGDKAPEDLMAGVNKQMVYVMPVVITFIFIYLKLPVVVGIYWLTTTIFSAGQQIVINKHLPRAYSADAQLDKE